MTKTAQYGNQFKTHAVYLSQHQLLPYKRIQEYFCEPLHIPLSEGSLYNFNTSAFSRLAEFEHLSIDRLAHADGTGININGKSHWLHCASNEFWMHYYPHSKLGTGGMDEIGILPRFKGVLCHDYGPENISRIRRFAIGAIKTISLRMWLKP